MEIFFVMLLGCLIGMGASIVVLYRENLKLTSENNRLLNKVLTYEFPSNVIHGNTFYEADVESPRYLH